MRLLGMVLSLAALVAVSGCEPAALSGPAADSRAHYVLALSWQPAFCETAPRRPECRSQTPDRPDSANFSLHGLWPQPGSRVWCGVPAAQVALDRDGQWRSLDMPRLPEPLWRRLIRAMPGARSSLHRHEWVKHGTCMPAASPDRYFRISLDLLEVVNASALRDRFAASIGGTLSGAQLRTAFEADFGPEAGERLRVACTRDGARQLIVEITIGLSGDLHQPIDAAAFERMVAAAPPTDPGCPGGVVDPALLQ